MPSSMPVRSAPAAKVTNIASVVDKMRLSAVCSHSELEVQSRRPFLTVVRSGDLGRLTAAGYG